jgi:hypothetical protein
MTLLEERVDLENKRNAIIDKLKNQDRSYAVGDKLRVISYEKDKDWNYSYVIMNAEVIKLNPTNYDDGWDLQVLKSDGKKDNVDMRDVEAIKEEQPKSGVLDQFKLGNR